jgi:hypothetical protein
MLDNNQYTPAQYTKAGSASATGSMGTMPAGSPRGGKKLFGMDRRSLLVALGLTSFLILTMAAVFIALNQRFRKETVAPTAPTQSSASLGNKCSLTFTVPQINTPVKSSHINVTCGELTGYVCDPDAPTKVFDRHCQS